MEKEKLILESLGSNDPSKVLEIKLKNEQYPIYGKVVWLGGFQPKQSTPVRPTSPIGFRKYDIEKLKVGEYVYEEICIYEANIETMNVYTL